MRVNLVPYIRACSPAVVRVFRIDSRFMQRFARRIPLSVTRLGHAQGKSPLRQRARGVGVAYRLALRPLSSHPLCTVVVSGHSAAQQIGQPDAIARRSFVAPRNAAGYLNR